MLMLKITINIDGDSFDAKSFLQEIIEDVYVEEYEEFPCYLTIQNPKMFGVEYELIEYEEWYVDFLEKYYSKMILYGAQDVWLFLDVFYSKDQCNFEIFSKEMMKKLAKFDLSYPISVYKLSKKKIKEYLLNVGFSKEKVHSFFQYD